MIVTTSRSVTTGVCSVSLRALEPSDVIAEVARTGLDGIEWGADIHVPVGDARRARAVADETEAAELRVLSYGSYWRAEDNDFGRVLETAHALRAPRVRVWAGSTGSAEATARSRTATIDRLRDAADSAADAGIELGTEFHSGTLTDTTSSAADLVREIGHPNLRTYWQPPIGMDDDRALASLGSLIDSTSSIHVFSWWPQTERRRLAERESLWAAVCARLLGSAGPHDMLLEFLPDDDPRLLAPEGEYLRDLLDRTRSSAETSE
ncbi:MAG TPA: TIM barrel protein [Pseudolysinimonas sp.]|nr:TIM barrel protein [Pseudolysinimonas sp.]